MILPKSDSAKLIILSVLERLMKKVSFVSDKE